MGIMPLLLTVGTRCLGVRIATAGRLLNGRCVGRLSRFGMRRILFSMLRFAWFACPPLSRPLRKRLYQVFVRFRIFVICVVIIPQPYVR